ncbi:phage integrase family protein [Burkholderia pseudomallei MSHR4032]|uniref:tyrosine-type recombinase/integrase n=1 Tax=Burkholderia pseudomallei TaxID=28450 RepID=UPI000537162B|nr:tyrosine-type recombinase/integrase [Burkholderia pseudomallei]KGV03427.1 phage integrase family protein [Burkholderia pseudomallei MSHR4032]KGW88003.1 phage integrase family protein [Burkholderia pseudomallei MSHR332]
MFERIVRKATPHRWYLAVSPLYPDEQPIIDWIKFLPPDIGTRHQRQYLLKSVKFFIKAIINMPSAKRHSTISHATVENWVRWTRRLVSWMVGRDIWRFSQLQAAEILDFLSERSYSLRGDKRPLSSARSYVVLFQWMWDLRYDYPASLRINPTTLTSRIDDIVPPDKRFPWKALDESIALPLIRDALKWVETHGAFVHRAVNVLSDTLNRCVGLTRFQVHVQVKQMYSLLDGEPGMALGRKALGKERAHSFIVVRHLLTQTEGACLIVLLFLVGFRCRELVNLDVDSMHLDQTEDGEPIYRLRGVAAKSGGLARTWVASSTVREVVEYMTLLYAQVRKKSGQKALFLSRAGGNAPQIGKRINRISTTSVAKRIKQFAGAPHRSASPKVSRLHPHSARKTFARFVVMRDKRALESLSYHFGHTHRMITDGCYVGADIELEKLIGEEARRDLANGLEDILRSGAVAGKAARSLQALKVDAHSGAYRGRRALQSLVDQLIEKGVQLAPCDWGYCVYSQSLSACRGTLAGPNEVNRSPDVCAGCSNFVVTEKHRAWWSDRLERDERFLGQASVPEQSRQLVIKRIVGTEKILRDLNARSRNGRETSST